MRTTGVTELKSSLSEMLARVKSGEEILVTEHGRPIARIVPLEAYDPEAGIDELIRSGLVKPPKGKLDVEAFLARLCGEEVDPEGLSLKALLEERRSGW
jgi:prevent-host-death family protein